MSLVNSTGYETANALTANYCFSYLFSNNSKIKNKTGSELMLPATTLKSYCYASMFAGCTNLITAPELPATTLQEQCYYGMFAQCTSLTTAPELPATTLGQYCYTSMFAGCTSLTTAPELPAITLAAGCYQNMFNRCTSLTTAPELPVTKPGYRCYKSMFSGCTSLNSVTCLATDISVSDCVNNWLDNVAASGTFIKAAGMTDWPSGANGIPSGWTVQDAP